VELIFLQQRSTRSLIFAWLVMLSLSLAASAQAAGKRDVLWDIVSNCLDPAAAQYCTDCRSPLVGTSRAAGLSCQETTEVWAETKEYVVLRDRKMCDCPETFVHGLAVPRARVTGVEDPKRPDGIWEFAWASAMAKINNEQEAALAVNPVATRAQDQLHVHILRLKKDARQRFGKAHTTRVRKLDEVWQAAGREAKAAGLFDYGILVAKEPDGEFVVLVDRVSPEKSYSIERCR
jgi:CDP-diacylglycerol pyrophosphatase